MFLLIASLLLHVSSAQAQTQNNVFGPDTRVTVTDEVHGQYSGDPLNRIVGIESEGEGCTGSLVWKNLVLTAAHCLPFSKITQGQSWTMSVYAHLSSGIYQDISSVNYAYWGTTTPDTDRAHDWAVVVLDKPLGNQFGWFGYKTLNLNQYKGLKVIRAGFDNDRYDSNHHAMMSLNQSCFIKDLIAMGPWLLDDCGFTRGGSGSPMFIKDIGVNGAVNWNIVALAVAELREGGDNSLFLPSYDPAHANIAVTPNTGFADQITKLRAKYP